MLDNRPGALICFLFCFLFQFVGAWSDHAGHRVPVWWL